MLLLFLSFSRGLYKLSEIFIVPDIHFANSCGYRVDSHDILSCFEFDRFLVGFRLIVFDSLVS